MLYENGCTIEHTKGVGMDDSMVTARMLDEKKRKGARILAREGLSASQAINLMYDKMI